MELKMKSKKHHNTKVAENRGDKWKTNLKKGKLDARLNPTKITLKRIEKDISQDQIAKKLEFSRTTYGSIERGQRVIKKDKAFLIASTLGTKISHIFTKTDDKYIATRA
jgi:DNA-binding XRE family transcriptional regulator